MNVLISSAGRRVSLVRAFQSDAREVAPETLVLASDLRPAMSSACQVADDQIAMPRVTDPCYVDALIEACQARDIRLIVPAIDPELPILAEASNRFSRVGIHVAVSDLRLVKAAGDKVGTPALLVERGIATPRAMTTDNLRFPLFVKPRDGSSSEDVLVARSQDVLTADHLTNPRFIFQEYMDPDEFDEVTVDLYYGRESELKCLVPRLRIATRAGEVSKGRTIRGELYSTLMTKLKVWPGARGCVTLQVFAAHANQDLFGIEVNPRFGGGYPLSHAAGAHFPEWMLREYLLDEHVSFSDDWETGLLMLRYDEGVFVHAPAD